MRLARPIAHLSVAAETWSRTRLVAYNKYFDRVDGRRIGMGVGWGEAGERRGVIVHGGDEAV